MAVGWSWWPLIGCRGVMVASHWLLAEQVDDSDIVLVVYGGGETIAKDTELGTVFLNFQDMLEEGR